MKKLPLGPIILDLDKLTLSAEEKEILLHPNLGGVIFFRRNYESPEQLTELVRSIKRLRSNLLLTVDQEGGRVQRFVQGLSKLPSLKSLANEDLNSIQKVGELMASEVISLGVDLSFAPVLDLDKGISDVIGDRSFHRNPEKVTEFASAYIAGMNKAGMKAVGKHYPGHGSVAVDSHVGLPEDLRTWDEISEDLLPFRSLSKKLGGIMPAHIIFPNIDPNPVGFSHFWLQTILREQLAFEGAIVSDCLNMGGAVVFGDIQARSQAALDAGCDYILVCNNRASSISALEGVKAVFDPLTQSRRENLLCQS